MTEPLNVAEILAAAAAKVDPANHSAEVLADLEALQKAKKG